MVNLYKMKQEILEAKQRYKASNLDKRDKALFEESILEMEENYVHFCKLYNDYDPEDIALSWD